MQVPPGQTIKEKKVQINKIPRAVVRLNKIYYIQEKFKKVKKCKTNSSAMQFEVYQYGN
jgi:hypothetical protein